MSRRDGQRLEDILAAVAAIGQHLDRGGLDDGLVFDVVRVRLIEIGEAVRPISPELLEREPEILWVDVAGMHSHLAHRYFDTAHAIVGATVEHDLPPLVEAVRRLLDTTGHERFVVLVNSLGNSSATGSRVRCRCGCRRQPSRVIAERAGRRG